MPYVLYIFISESTLWDEIRNNEQNLFEKSENMIFLFDVWI